MEEGRGKREVRRKYFFKLLTSNFRLLTSNFQLINYTTNNFKIYAMRQRLKKTDFCLGNSGGNLKKLLVIPVMVLLSILSGTYALAQEGARKITGTVIAADDNSPIPGANVIIKGTQTGTVTDMNGNFTINASSEDILVFSFLGYAAQEVAVKDQNNIAVRLISNVTKLDEVVVVGYGQMKRSDLTGSVVSVSADEIKQSVGSSFDQALQGKAAGVFVTQNTGAPGGGVSVRIRGINSITNSNEPLYVIDGVQIDGYTGGIRYNNSIGNILSTINPSDIEDMQILKDASATAIYGSRAANGVIIITTKKGKSGESTISYDGYYGIQQVPKTLPTMNLREFAEYRQIKDTLLGHGGMPQWEDPSLLGEGTNWQNELFRNAPMQNHQVTVSGGNEKTTFAVSGGYFAQDGIAVGSNFERYTIKLNVDNKARDWFRIGTNIMANRSKQNITVENEDIINTALNQTPDVLVKDRNGDWAGPDSNLYGTYITNPIAMALIKENERRNSQVIANGYLEITLLKGLVLKNELSGNVSFSNRYEFTPTYNFGEYVKNVISNSSRGSNNSTYWSFNNYLTYYKTFMDRHDMIFMLGHEASESNWEGISGSRTNFFTNSIHELDAGDSETAQNSGNKGSSAMESFFGRLNYSFADKYLLTATIRADGSSKFGPERRWGYFPSFALAWKISNEKFLTNIEQISSLKLRAGWGEVGNQNIIDYAYGSPLGNRATTMGTGVLPQRIGNPLVQWESSISSNVGIDLYLFKNRVEFIVDAYIKKTDNCLLPLPLPAYAGTIGGDYSGAIESPYVNIGALENRGFEFTLNTTNINRNDFTWKTGIVFSTNKNKVKKLTTENAVIDGMVGTDLMTRTQVGNPIGMFYGYVVDGMFNTEDDFYRKDESGNFILDGSGNKIMVALPVDADTISVNRAWVGDFRFRDINGDSVITEMDRTFIGNPNPKFTMGFNTNLNYKNFDLSVNLFCSFGNDLYNWTKRQFENPNYNTGVMKSVADFARIGVKDPDLVMTDPSTGEAIPADQIISNVYIINQGGTIPRLANYSANANNRISNLWVEDGSYLRIRNIVLGYNLPKTLIKKLDISSLRLYINIQNLYTFSKYKGYDPEVGSINQDMRLSGIDNGRYPSPRVYTFGLNVNF